MRDILSCIERDTHSNINIYNISLHKKTKLYELPFKLTPMALA